MINGLAMGISQPMTCWMLPVALGLVSLVPKCSGGWTVACRGPPGRSAIAVENCPLNKANTGIYNDIYYIYI